MSEHITFFYLDPSNQPQGPLAPRDLASLRRTGQVSWETLIAEPDADEWLPMSIYADVIEPGVKVTTTAELQPRGSNPTLKAAGSGLQILGAAVTLANPIVGVGMIVAGSKVKKAGE